VEDFTGKVAVVTGAASGMGLAFATRFADEGVKVVMADIEPEPLKMAEEELRRKGGAVLAHRTDVGKYEQVEALADLAFKTFGNIHILCNNAGVSGPQGALWELSLGDWEWIMDVNLWSVIYGIRAFLPRMLANGEEGHVVNTASMAALTQGSGPYGITKHGVLAISESLYTQLKMADARIGVSVLCPGWVNTQIMESQRRRPSDYGPPAIAEITDPARIQQSQMVRQFLANGFPPAEIAGIVFDAIRTGKFYLTPTQPGMFDGTIAWHRRIENGENPVMPQFGAWAQRQGQ
jgi:NAD(P)-dependent dehydrogenase (short-subunit alcohol dehydrogenase family)